MKFVSKRAGALATAAVAIATMYGTIAAGAYAQDQAEADTLEQVTEIQSLDDTTSEMQIRFVADPVVQPIADEAMLEDEGEAGEIAPVSAASLHELVAGTDTGAALSREMLCLAQAVYFESRGEPLSGQLAVARVVINRTESNQFPDDYCSVVTQRAQFSFVRGGRIPEPNRGSVAWQRAKAIARIAHRDEWASEADDALFFHATYVRPSWARTKQARATIDRHIFYR